VNKTAKEKEPEAKKDDVKKPLEAIDEEEVEKEEKSDKNEEKKK